MRCFLVILCKENCDIYLNQLILNLLGFLNVSEKIDLTISQIFEKIVDFIPFDIAHRNYFSALEVLFRSNREGISIYLIKTMKKIIQKNRSLIQSDNNWMIRSLIDCCCYYDNETEKIAYETISLLNNNTLKLVMMHKNIRYGIKSLLHQFESFDICKDGRLEPMIHAIITFFQNEPLECTKYYLKRHTVHECLIHVVINGTFHIKKTAGFLLMKAIQQFPSPFLQGMIPEYQIIYKSKLNKINEAIYCLMDIDDEELYSNIILSLDVLVQHATNQGLIDDIKEVLDSSGITEIIDQFQYASSSKLSEESRMFLINLEIYQGKEIDVNHDGD